uniref:Immunoglobulin domain-containing protein n=1 Tax=Kryptolebias marmoratus TaxID=37003 RepID=A0A3Q3AP56_KRYMA
VGLTSTESPVRRSWILVSVSGSHFVKVQPGEDVTLNSSIMTTADSVKVWFRLDNRNMTNCIAIMINKDPSVNYCEGNPNGTFKMSLTTSTVSLQIKKVNSSDSGWYFCVFYTNTFLFNVTYLHVNVAETLDDSIKQIIGLLGGLTALLLVIIVGLVVQNKKLQKEFLNIVTFSVNRP